MKKITQIPYLYTVKYVNTSITTVDPSVKRALFIQENVSKFTGGRYMLVIIMKD